MAEIHILCDASFSGRHGIAVAGYLIVEGNQSPTHTERSPEITTSIFDERTNIRAELRGAITALEALSERFASADGDAGNTENHAVNLYTDCQTIVGLPDRREKLESANYVARRSGKSVSNEDLYREFFAACDRISLDLHWVKGHSPAGTRDSVGANFSRLDRAVRKLLREKCAELNEEGAR